MVDTHVEAVEVHSGTMVLATTIENMFLNSRHSDPSPNEPDDMKNLRWDPGAEN